jgi:hypothetical protein
MNDPRRHQIPGNLSGNLNRIGSFASGIDRDHTVADSHVSGKGNRSILRGGVRVSTVTVDTTNKDYQTTYKGSTCEVAA